MAIVAEDRQKEVQQYFQTLFSLQEGTLNGKRERALFALRKEAVARLGELSFPSRRDEDWKYTSVTKVLQPKYQDPQALELEASAIAPYRYPVDSLHELVFVNGILDERLSTIGELPAGAVITSMEKALEDDRYRPLIDQHFSTWAKGSNQAFIALNLAFARHGVFIHLPANVVVERPIHLLNLSVPQAEPLLISPQCLVIAGRSSEATLLESYHELPGGEGAQACFTNIVNRIALSPNANLRHYRFQWQGAAAFTINNTVVDQERDSTYSSFNADLGGSIVRNNLSAMLKDQSTMTNLYGVFLGAGDQHIDNQTLIDHAFPHCQSNELYKGALAGRSRGVFNGKVMVHPDAQKTNAFQQNSTLVLSDKAQMDSKPQLEIFADDVRCSHGATIGQLEEDSIFYLRSRGLKAAEARALLQHAFIREVLDLIHLDEIRETVDGWVLEKFAEQSQEP